MTAEKKAILFTPATVDILREQCATAPGRAWLKFVPDGKRSTVQAIVPPNPGEAAVTFAPNNDAHVCPGDPACPK